jgi:hypothetical protein
MGRPKSGQLRPKPLPLEKIKPFNIKHYSFYPCSFTESRKLGFKYFLFVKYHKNGFPVPEIQSPRFKSTEEARNFVEQNQFTKFVVG